MEKKITLGNGARTQTMMFNIAFYILMVILCIMFLMPFTVMLTTSLRTNKDAFTLPVSLLPRVFTIDNYPAALSTIPYFRYMGNTLFITILSVLGQLIATPMVAYSLSKIQWKGRTLISSLLLATMMIPYTVTMIPLYRIYSNLDLTNTYVPLILPQFFGSAFFIIIVRQFFLGLPNSIMEAARIDGANEFQRYINIALPMCKPALTTVAIYAFINAWSDYLAPMIYINKTAKLTLSLGLQQFMSQYNTAWSQLMAAATLFVLPVIIFYVLLQRNFVEGIATSGLKA